VRPTWYAPAAGRPLMTQVQHWAKTAQTDDVTLQPWPLTLEVMAPVGWCGSSSIRMPSLKFVGFAVRKIWRTMCVIMIRGPGDLDLETCVRVASKVGNLHSEFGHTIGLRVLELFAMLRTGGQKQRSVPPSVRARGIKVKLPIVWGERLCCLQLVLESCSFIWVISVNSVCSGYVIYSGRQSAYVCGCFIYFKNLWTVSDEMWHAVTCCGLRTVKLYITLHYIF